MRRRYFVALFAGLLAASAAAAQAPKLPAAPVSTVITPGGATATTVAPITGATQVSTATISGGNAYNQFTTFQIAQGDTVDLIVPTAATNNNLLNLVTGSATQIYGTLNSLLQADNKIGGNIFFADPSGIIVGSSGVMNVGALTFATPSSDFVNNFFNDTSGNTATLLAGTEPLSSDGLIAVLGQINTAGPASLTAPTVAVSGGISTGAAQFGSLVNTAGLQAGQAISVNGNSITIDGGEFGGTASASLNAGTDDINLTANPSDSEAIATAAADITLGAATLSGNNINIDATASSTSDDSLTAGIQQALTDTQNLPWQIISQLATWNTTSSTATINLGAGPGVTTLNALGNVKIAAEANSTTKVGTISPVISLNYGVADATSTANLGANAHVTAAGGFTLSALNNNTLNMTPNSVGPGVPSVTVSYGQASSNSTTTLAGSVQASTVGVTADNENSFLVSAGDSAAENGLAGVGVAIGSFSSNANATLSGSATATGADITNPDGSITPALNVAAIADNTTDQILSQSETTDSSTLSSVTNAGTGGFTFLTELYSFISKLGSSKVNSEDNSSSPLGLAAAVSYLSSSNSATTTASGTANANAGSAGITSSATDKPQSSAGGSAGSAKASIGGGVAYANFDNTANTTVSGSVTGNQGVNIAANATLPDPFSLTAFTSIPGEFNNFQFVAPSSISDYGAYSKDWQAAQSLGGDLVGLFNPSNSNNIGQYLNNNLGAFNLVTSFVQSGASGEAGSGGGSSFGLAASVNILGITNQATATVASGANVVANNNGVNVAANSNAYLINLAGMVFDLGQLKDFNPGASGDAAIGGTYNGFNFTNGATAAVNDGAQITTQNGGAVNVNGTTNETLIDVAQAGDNAGKFGVNGTFNWVTLNNTAEGYIQSNAVVDAAGAVNVNGTNTLAAYTIGGALGYGGSAEIGATVGWNQLTNNTLAYIGDPGDARTSSTGSVTAGNGGVNLDASTNDTLWNVSLAAELATGQKQDTSGSGDTAEGGGSGSGGSGGSGSFGLGISGNVAINDITDTTQAYINNAANIYTPGAVGVTAQDNSFAVSAGLAFALAASGDGTGVTLGGAFARNDFTKTTEAWIDNALVTGILNPQTGDHAPAGSLNLQANSTGNLLTISAGASISTGDGVGIAGSANNDVVTNTTEAGLGSGANVNVSGAANIAATQHDRVLAIAGALSYAGNVGIGAALDYSNYTNTTKAYIGDGAVLTAGGNISVTASTDEQLLPIIASLGASDNVGLAGAASKDEIQNDTEATIGAAKVNTDSSLVLGADDNSQLLLIVGSLGGAGDVGVGVSGAISIQSQPLFDRTVKATVASGAEIQTAANAPVPYQGQDYFGLLADATAEGGADTIVAGVGGAGDVGVAASLALNYFTEDVEATVDGSINPADAANNTTPGRQNVAVNASDSAQILDVVGDIAGSGAVSVGAAADVQFLNRTVKAEIGGNVQSNANIAATAAQGGSDWSVAGAGSFSGSVNIAGSASALFDTSTVTADIAPSAVVYTPGSIDIAAQRTENINTIDGELGISGDAGIGASLSLLEQNDTTTADVGANAQVTALGEIPITALVNIGNDAQNGQLNGLAVTANANDTLLTIAAGGQASLGVSLAGSVVLNDIADTTNAYVDSGAVVNPANGPAGASQQAVDVLASDSTNLTSGAGALAVGINIYGVGLGAAVNLEGAVAQLPSVASGFQSSLSGDLNGVSDNAASNMPGGFSKNTSAGVNNGATVNAAGALTVAALSSETLNNYDAAIGGGIAGLAGSVELDDYAPTTTAYFGQCVSAINCSGSSGATANVGSASVNANDTFNYFSVVGAAEAGGGALGASVLDATVGADTSAYVGAYSSLTANKGVAINSNFTDTYSSAILAGGIGGLVANVPYATITDQSDNSAFIADNATVAGGGGPVNVDAVTQRTVSALSGAAVAGGLGIGATILDVNFNGSTAADIAPGATVSTGNTIGVLAQLDDSVPQYLILPSDIVSALSTIPGINGNQISTGILGASVAALAGIGGQVTITDNARDTAFVAAASLTAGDGISVTADDEPNLWAQSAAAEAGAIGAGASISDINLGGAVSATFNTNATATHGSIQVGSTLIETLNGDATGIGGGLATGNGTVVNINDSNTNALSQSGSATASNGDVSFIANTTRNAFANAGSTNAGLLAVGISFADINLDGSTSAELDGSATASASSGSATLEANDTDHAIVDAIVDAKGGVNGVGAMAGSPNGLSANPSRIDPTVTTTVGSGASVSAAVINILANDSSTLNSTANGGIAGFVHVGLVDAEGVVDPNLTLNMNGSLSGGTITVENTGNQSVTSNAQSPQSSSVLSLYSTTDGANANPTVYLNFNGSANGTGDVTVESDSNSTVSATANADQNYDAIPNDPFSNITVLAAGLTTSNAGINNENVATSYGTISSSSGNAALNAVSVNDVTQNDATGGTGSGVAEGALTNATTKVYDTTHANLDGALDALAGTASVLASETDNATSDAYISSSGWSGIDYVESSGYTGVNASPIVNVDGGANIQANAIDITATLPEMMSGANATAQAQKGFAGDGYAYSNFEGIFNPTIEVHPGAQLTAPTIAILANVGTPTIPVFNGILGASDATAGTESATGTASANATNNATLLPGVKLDSASTLTTNNLSVKAIYPLVPLFGSTPTVSGVSTVTWVAEQVQEVVNEVVGWLPFGLGQDIESVVQTVTKWVEVITNSNVYANAYGTFNPGSAVTVDSTIQQLGTSNGATLTIGPNGQPTTADGLSVQNEDNNNILVNSLINTSNPLQISLTAQGGTVGGNPTIIENNMPPFVNITNDSNLNLVLQQLSPISGNGGNPPLTIQADTDTLSPNFVNNQNPTAITIANNGSGDVLFTNVIADQPGSLDVTNLGGSILGTVNSLLEANQIALDAPHGSIGSAAGTSYACPICPAADPNGNVILGPLTLQPNEGSPTPNAPPLVPQVSAVAVGDINLAITPNEHVAGGVASGAPSVDLTNILAGGDANITLNPANVQGVELVPVTINLLGIPYTFELPEQVNGPSPNTDYNVGAGQWLAAGGNLNLNFGGGNGSQVTLNDNGLVASGFEGINFVRDPFNHPISNVVADGQTNSSLLNYLQSITGPPVLSNLNASSGGHVVFNGSGAVAGNGTIAVLDGESNVGINNVPAVQSILDPGVNTSLIAVFGNNEPLTGTFGDGSVSLSSYGVPGGQIDLQSNAGLNIAGTLFAPLGSIQAASQGDLNSLAGTLYGGTLVNLTSDNGSLLLGPIIVPGGNLIATAAADITGNALITAGNATLNAKGGSITLQQATIGHIVNLLANQNITTLGPLTAGGAANLNAQNGNILLNQSLAANGITAAAGQDITNLGTLLSLGDATLNANHGNINGLGLISVQGNATLAAGQSIALQALLAGQSASLRALAGDINLGNLNVANGPALLTAGGSINAANGSIAAATDANLTANGDINLGNLQAGSNVNLMADGSINAASGSIAAGNDATLQTKTGDILLGALFAGNNANLTAAGSIDAGNGVLQAGNSAALDAANAITLGQLTAGQNASLTAANGDINLGSVTATAGNATLTAGGNINAANGSVTAGGDASLTANQNITLGTVEAGQNATLQSTRGDINLGQVTATAGDAALSAGGNINAANGTVTAGTDATLNAAGEITLGAVTAGQNASLNALIINLGTVTAGHDAALTAGGSINAANGSVTAGNDATLTAADNIALGTVTAAGNAQITAQNGFLDFGTIVAGQNANLTAGQDINAATGAITDGTDANVTAGGSINALGLLVNSGHDASLTAVAGSINTGNAAITAGTDATLAAGQNITLGTVLSGQNATLTAQAGDINLGSVTATAGDATLTAGHDINAATGSITDGTDANLTAAQDITLGTVLSGQNATLTAQAGDINLGSVTATAGDATLTAGDSINAATGSITDGTDANLTAAQDITLGTVLSGQNATLTAQAGDINLGSVTATAGDATLTAGDSINAATGSITDGTDANLTAAQDITLGTVLSGQNATLTAQAGDINLGSVTATAGDAALTAGHSIYAANGTVTAGHDATLTAQSGDIDLGTVTAANNATLTANDNINIGAAGSVTAGSTATLTTLVNDINLLGTVTAPTAILTANHSISGGGTVIANVTQLAAETGAIGATGDNLNVEMNTIAGVTPTLSAGARNDINLNLTAIAPVGPAGPASDSEPTGGQPTLYASLVSILAGGNLNLNLNQGVGASGAENAWYEVPQGSLAIAGGNVAVNEAAPTGDYAAVTLDLDGLLASGFQSLNYTISPTGAWSTTVGIAGQTASGPVNFGTIANGVINLSNIDATQGGQIAITGTGQLGNAANVVAFTGAPSVTVNNLDPNLTLQANDIALGFIHGGVQLTHPNGQGTGIRFVEGGFGFGEFGHQGGDDHGFGDDEHNNGNEVHGPNAAGNDQNNADGSGQGGDGGQDGPTLTLNSAGGVTLAGQISNPDGTTSISGAAGISGAGLTESQLLNLASLDGGIGSAAAPLAVGIGDGGQLNASAAGDIAISAPAGDLPLGMISTPGNIYLSTPAGSIGNALRGEEEGDQGYDGRNDQDLPVNNLSGNNISLTAAGSIGDEDHPLIGVATGAWTIAAGDDLNLTSGANMNVASLTAEDANLNVDLAGGSLNIAAASISDSLNAQADNIAIAQLSHAGPVNPLNLSLTGNDGRMAQTINVAVTSAAPVLVQNYASQTGGITLSGDWLYVDGATIGQSATFQNSWLNVALANTDARGRAQDATLDMVGNLISSHADHDLSLDTTQLQPGVTFTLPSQLTPTQEWMVDGLRLAGHDHDSGRH